jgi:hypothetical protein
MNECIGALTLVKNCLRIARDPGAAQHEGRIANHSVMPTSRYQSGKPTDNGIVGDPMVLLGAFYEYRQTRTSLPTCQRPRKSRRRRRVKSSAMIGAVTQSKPARFFGRAGALHFDFRQLVIPGETTQNVEASVTEPIPRQPEARP